MTAAVQQLPSPAAAYGAGSATRFLIREAQALLTRLNRVRTFAATMPMTGGAAVSPAARDGIELHLILLRRQLKQRTRQYLRWLQSPVGNAVPVEQQQRRFTLLRLQFNAVLDQGDIFADVLTQRGEHETGLALAGLDILAADALNLAAPFYEPPPVVTYLDRGHGAAIRRARTRLPGGGSNPVAIIRIPRERMAGSGIGSSLVHEVGHQAAALLDAVAPLRDRLRRRQAAAGDLAPAWSLWERWISEIAADFWAVAKIGVSATVGLIGVVSLPRAFVFRIAPDDPHPFPWIRVVLSCAFGATLYPDPQWRRLRGFWEQLYPSDGLTPAAALTLRMLRQTVPEFIELLTTHRLASLRGASLREVMPILSRQPARLRALYRIWRLRPNRMLQAPPTLAFAVLGQASADHRLDVEQESETVSRLLRHWALTAALPKGAGKVPTRESRALIHGA